MRSHLRKLIGVCALAAVTAGCGMAGSWSSASLSPEMARDEFAVVGRKPVGAEFTRADITLRDDHTYTADVHYGDDVVRSSGTWEKKGEEITFVDSHGTSRTYETELSGDHRKLTLVRPIEGTDVRLVMKRQS